MLKGKKMKKMTVTIFVLAFVVFSLASQLSYTQEAADTSKQSIESPSISISAFEFRNTTGVAIVTLYNVEDTWTEIPKAYKRVARKISGKSIWVKFKDLKPGTYAIYVLHDENKNNKMDMKWFPYPRPGEGVGSSNNYKGRPKWKHAKFDLGKENKKIRIRLRYL